MTRINTNVPSITAQQNLARNNASLNISLTRLSTGLRINTGKDDPAGLIASEALRSDITATNKAISNTQRANQVIGTADSALSQVSTLLNDVRGLITEAANTGAMSPDQIAANQLQIDSSIEAINRIAKTTTFQGRKLLDGSLDFTIDVDAAANYGFLQDVSIDQAMLGVDAATNTRFMDVNVTVTQAATQASVTLTGMTAADQADVTVQAGNGAYMDYGTNGKIGVLALNDQAYDVTLSGVQTGGGGATSVVLDTVNNTLTITLDGDDLVGTVIADPTAITATEMTTWINNALASRGEDQDSNPIVLSTLFQGYEAVAAGGGEWNSTTGHLAGVTETMDKPDIVIEVDAAAAGSTYNNMSVLFTSHANGTGVTSASYDSTTHTLTISMQEDAVINDAALEFALTNSTGWTAAVPTPFTGGNVTITGAGNGRDTFYVAAGKAQPDATMSGTTGATGGEVLQNDVVFELAGQEGSELMQFGSGADVNQLVAAINLVADSVGVAATAGSGLATLQSVAYGTNAYIKITTIEDVGGMFDQGVSTHYAIGTDANATINGFQASTDGNRLSIDTSTLKMSTAVTAGTAGTAQFRITGGGALFQLGPEVVGNQQANMGIKSLSSGSLGTEADGYLYELGSGNSASLVNDTTAAYRIVNQAITQVSSLRGRLGAFQKTTLETNETTLNDTVQNLIGAESMIRDADFAAESASMTRAQILVQSTTTVLSMANQQPQNVLRLLGG